MMIGFSKDKYKELWQMVRNYKLLATLGQVPEDIEAEAISAFRKWSDACGIINADQLRNGIEAFERAVVYDIDTLFALEEKLISKWEKSYGAGNATMYSYASQSAYTFGDYFTFTYISKSSSVSQAPGLFTPYSTVPITSHSSATHFEENGLFIISSPAELLLISDKGRNSFVHVKSVEGMLHLDHIPYTRA